MAASGDGKTWYTAAELADLALPGLPKAKRKVNELAADRRWALQLDRAGAALARPRAARGGGLEYHVSLLPPSAMTELMRRGLLSSENPSQEGNASNCISIQTSRPVAAVPTELWAWFDRQNDKTKTEAKRRLKAIDEVEALERNGLTRSAAVASVAAAQGCSVATLWNWLALVAGVPVHDRLPRIAPRHKAGGAEAEIDPQAWQIFKSDYLRPERPTLASCYERLKLWAKPRGLVLPSCKTLQRKMEREVDARVIISLRLGDEALRRTQPAQQRSISDLHALELVNIDGHRWDVFVRWPARNGEPEVIARPMMVAIQDVYSRKFLAWRIGRTESAVQTRLAFADLFQQWGIPDACLLDNGRAFASKWITGGSATRFRFKIRDEDPAGLLTTLGIRNHWAKPYRGQSKPIERGFRDLCDHGAKHPAFAGAYTGNKPDAKPENYGSAAVDLDVFKKIVGQVMEAHNARTGRRTEAACGRSFDIAFAESYARHPIRKAKPEQLRMALLTAEQLTADRQNGSITLYENRFWTEELHALAGQKVVVRFDPENLTGELHVYRMDGRFVATAPCIAATGFLDVDAAKTRAKQEGDMRRHVRQAAKLEDLLTAQDLAAMLPDDPTESEPLQPTVIRPVRTARNGAAAARRAPIIDRLNLDDLAPARATRPPLRVVE